MKLNKRFKNLVNNFNISNKVCDFLWLEIEENYSNNKRFYHNLKHLQALFDHYDSYKIYLENTNEIAFAIFYHDIIYNIWRKDNEQRSADIATKRLNNFGISTEKVHEYIMATKSHEGNSNDAKFMIDFDLAILGQDKEVYKNYTKLIRKEYRLIPSTVYKKGRIKVLHHFISKPTIYKTTFFSELYEKRAKENLITELKELHNGF